VLTWTVGSGGLIGSAVSRSAERRFTGSPIPWSRDSDASVALSADLARFTDEARRLDDESGTPWAIVWAAGAATVSSSEEAARSEAELFRSFAETLSRAALPARGTVLLVSSAGGVHAGSVNPPFSATSAPAPISPYGRARLAQEQAAMELLSSRWPVIIARVSNVYGPGQDIGKLQGLVSRLAVCSLTREPLNLFVPLATVRDFIYVDDVAARIMSWLAHATGMAPGAHVRILASGQGTSIGQLVRTAQDVGHRRVPIAMGSHPSSAQQAPDLRFIPTQVEGLQDAPLTPLPVGMKRVFDDIQRRFETAVP
jgi:UDP-glucose 4-epimerase